MHVMCQPHATGKRLRVYLVAGRKKWTRRRARVARCVGTYLDTLGSRLLRLLCLHGVRGIPRLIAEHYLDIIATLDLGWY